MGANPENIKERFLKTVPNLLVESEKANLVKLAQALVDSRVEYKTILQKHAKFLYDENTNTASDGSLPWMLPKGWNSKKAKR